ncbi:MAG: hypothetical protein AAGA48_10300 [Myxococcota bacterium]
MATVTLRTLRARLARVEALERGATTPGERSAASAARARLVARIARVRSQDPVVQFVNAHLDSLGIREGGRPPPPPDLPSPMEIRIVLQRWADDEWHRQDVQAWAEDIVDRVVLPTDADHPDAAVGEVLMQLAMLHRVRLQPHDVEPLVDFMTTHDWHAWFEFIAARSSQAAGA